MKRPSVQRLALVAGGLGKIKAAVTVMALQLFREKQIQPQ
jgi:hypothetical protein